MTEQQPSPCANCGRQYRKDKLNRCPACGIHEQTWLMSQHEKSVAEVVESTSTPIGVSEARRAIRERSDGPDAATQLLERILRESTKTKHAVRSLARFLMIMVTSSLIGGAILGLGIGTMAWPIIVIGSLATLIGYIVAIADAWSELNQSN